MLFHVFVDLDSFEETYLHVYITLWTESVIEEHCSSRRKGEASDV